MMMWFIQQSVNFQPIRHLRNNQIKIMFKKIIALLLPILEFILVAAANIINYFTHKKIGMARHMVYMNQKWLAVNNFEIYKISGIVLLLITVTVIFFIFIKNIKSYNTIVKINFSVLVLFLIYYLFFSITNSADGFRAFYLMYYIYTAAIFFMIINVLTGMSGRSK
mgnify:FL=1